MTGSSLVAIDSQFVQVCALAQDYMERGEALPAEIEEQISELLIAREDKIDNTCRFLNDLQSRIDFAEGEIKIAQEWVKRQENFIEHLLGYAKKIMVREGVTTMRGTTGHRISTRKSTRVVVDCNPEQLPMEYQKTKIEADRETIKDALKTGIEIEGCRLEESVNVSWK
jgi:Gp157 protein